MRLHLTKPLAFLDLTTTGPNIVHDRIVQIAVLVLSPDGSSTCYTCLVNPELEVPNDVMKQHEITEEDVQSAKTFKECAPKFVEVIGNADISGYNVREFGIPMLEESFYRAKIWWSHEGRYIVDLKEIFHCLEKHNLQAALSFYRMSVRDNHSVLDSVISCKALLEEQVERYCGRTIQDCDGNVMGKFENDVRVLHYAFAQRSVDLAGKLIWDKDNKVVINFGKYLGKSVRELMQEDRDYLESLTKNSSVSRDTRRTLRREIQSIEFDDIPYVC